jgi:SAM-dependent methyltransferase/uncharacterized protein YbaR (Trm112 family)
VPATPPDFTCPTCRSGALVRRGSAFVCVACAAKFPLVDDIPWLFADPDRALADWRLRLHRLLLELRHEAGELRASLERAGLATAARNRLKLLAAAHDDHANRLAELLAPSLGAEVTRVAHEMHRALGTPVQSGPGVAAYYVNLHRDWVWGADETEAMYAEVTGALAKDAPGRVLVLGAGAGRLVHDLAVRLQPDLTVALDVNPLLAIVGRRVMNGQRISLYEFPLAPRDVESHALLRTLAVYSPGSANVHWVLADATHAPFAPGSFDTVVTPWLIDVIDADFAAFAAGINVLLRDGGRWINTGSLVFSNPDRAARYTLDEVRAIAAAAGFSALQVTESTTKYMCSPASRHGRVESVVTFRADKERSVPAWPEAPALPRWLEPGDEPIPALPAFQSEALTMRIHGYLASLIDGRRTLADIANELVRERLMSAAEARAAVRGFVGRLYADSLKRPRF